MTKANTIFPIQKLPMSKKTEEWKKSNVDYIAGMSNVTTGGNSITRAEEIKSYYDLYNGIYNEKDLRHVTNPFKQDEGFPATPQNFNIIRPKINVLIGEESKRPFNFNVIRTSDIAASDVQDKYKQMVIQTMMSRVMANMSEEQAAEYQEKLNNGEILPPADIQKYMSRSYKDMAETVANYSLKSLYQSLNMENCFMKAWEDGIIAGEEIAYVGVLNGEPYMERVNPLDFTYEYSPDIEYIENASWCCRKSRMSYNEIYDRFYDKMDNKQLDELLDIVDGRGTTMGLGKSMIADFNHIKSKIVSSYDDLSSDSFGMLDVYHTCWKSFKKIGFVKIVDEEGIEQEFIIDENYVRTGNEEIEWDWMIEVWEGYRIGESLYIGIQPLEYQHMIGNNLNSQKLPYTGVVHSNNNSSPKSLVSIMKPLQYWYIILWYRLELALARDKGKVLNMDVTQIPKSMNIDVAKWMHYLSALGVNFINPYEDGWDAVNREGGKPATFNQIAALDLTMTQSIDQYINLMYKIESMVSEISGITPQRQGGISQNELVGNVQQSIIQSSYITEPLFWKHNQFKKRALTLLLNTAKAVWANSGKNKLHYIFDDGTRTFMDISEDFYYEDLDIYVSDSTKDSNLLEQIKMLYQPAMQNGASLLDIAEIMTMTNISEIKNKLSEIEEARSQQAQQSQQQEAEQQERLVQMQNQVKEQELMLKQAELELAKYKIDQDNMTKLTIAEIGSYSSSVDMDLNNNNIADQSEIAANAIKRQELASKQYQKNAELNYKSRIERDKINSTKEIENKKIDLEKTKIDASLKLQREKDKAALEREKIKARVAIKNKVPGEK